MLKDAGGYPGYPSYSLAFRMSGTWHRRPVAKVVKKRLMYSAASLTWSCTEMQKGITLPGYGTNHTAESMLGARLYNETLGEKGAPCINTNNNDVRN